MLRSNSKSLPPRFQSPLQAHAVTSVYRPTQPGVSQGWTLGIGLGPTVFPG